MHLGTLLTKAAWAFRDRIAISYGESHETYGLFNDRVNRLVNALTSLGVQKQDRVAIIQNNCPQLIESFWACYKGGYATVPTNSRLHPAEFSYVLQNSESSVVILGDEFKDTIHKIKNDIPSVKHFICLSNPDEGMLDYERLIIESSKDDVQTEIDSDDLAWLIYTSGTTGKPKGAMNTHGNLMVMLMNFLADLYPMGPEDVAFHAAPLTHGSGALMHPLIARGSNNVILKSKRFEPKLVFEAIEKERVTILPFLAPTMIKMLLASPDLDRYDLSSLKCIIYGGAPMYVEDLKEAIRRFGPILVQLYGQAEAPATISYLRREEHVLSGTEEQIKHLSSAGIARTDVEVKIFDDDDNEMAQGELGEIVARGKILMKGYWRNPEATAETLRHGWLHTGDVGYMDEKGFLYIMDRKKDMVISGGSNIYSREVEDVILRHPAVQEVAVIGVPDSIWGESVKAIVVLKQGTRASQEEIIDFCKQNMASYKKPRSVDFVDALPKSAYGKVQKTILREKHWKGREKQV